MVASGLATGAVNQCQVIFFHGSAGELGDQLAVGEIILGDQQYAGSILVQAMHDARPQIPANLRETSEVMQQCVH